MFDVFISYSVKDRAIAEVLKTRLEAGSIRAWKAPENILPGQVWEEAITDAISFCKVTLLVWSADSQDSRQVKRELTLAASMNKIIVPLRIQEIEPEGTFAYYLTNTHWLDAFSKADSKAEESGIAEVVDRVSKILKSRSEGEPIEACGTNRLGSKIRDQGLDSIVDGMASERVPQIEGLYGFTKRDSRDVIEASEEIGSQPITADGYSTESLSWEARRKESDYFDNKSSDKILLTDRYSGKKIHITADVLQDDKAIVSIDGEVFDAAPLGSNEYYADTKFTVSNSLYRLYISFSGSVFVRITLLSVNGSAIAIAGC